MAKNMEGIIECQKKKGVLEERVYIELMKESIVRFRVSDSIFSFVQMVEGIVEFFEGNSDKNNQIKIIREGLILLEKAEDPNDRCNLVFKQIELCVENNLYKPALDICFNEYDIFTKKRPQGLKRKVYALNCIVLSLLLRDEILGEKLLQKFGNE